MTVPLLIGGATTSGKHTAVKIAPAYTGSTVHVPDASLAVGVLGKLMSADRDDYLAEVAAKQAVAARGVRRRRRSARCSRSRMRARARAKRRLHRRSRSPRSPA